MENKAHEGQRLEIVMDDEVAQGYYVNLAVVNHSSDEFTFDFVYVPPNSPKAKLRARIISSPSHTKRLLMALQENVRRYEERFGTINLSQPAVGGITGEMGHA
jgi:hypothetical protein